MKVISPANETVLKILRTPKSTDGNYRKMHFCVEQPMDDGVLLFHTLTKELLLLTQQEYAQHLELDYLREHWFVVPEGTKDKEYSDLVKWVWSHRQKKGKEITSYSIFTTTDCNARCFYCFELGRSRMPMDQETALKVVQFIKKNCGGKAVNITWFGGEPLYNMDVIDTISAGLREAGIDYSSKMITNGYLFDEESVEKAVQLWNLKRLQITLDGTESAYNRIKAYIYKEGNPYQRVLKNIGLLLDASIFVDVRLNLGKNLEDLLQLSQELGQRFAGKKNLAVYAQHLFSKTKTMAETYSEDEWVIRNENMRRLEALLKEKGLISQEGISQKICLHHCRADSGTSVTILPDGSVGLCDQFSDSEFIGHIDREGFDADVVKSWRETSPEIEACATCFYHPYCVMLKKCPSGGKCFPQRQERYLRKVLRQMENEYTMWKEKDHS